MGKRLLIFFFFSTECEILPRYLCYSEQSKRERWESNCAGYRDGHRTPVHDGSFGRGRFLLCNWGERLLGVAHIQHILCGAPIFRLCTISVTFVLKETEILFTITLLIKAGFWPASVTVSVLVVLVSLTVSSAHVSLSGLLLMYVYISFFLQRN